MLKELDILTHKDQAEIHQEQNQQKEYKFIGSIKLRPGLKLYAYNPEKDELKEVELVSKAVVDMGGNVIKNRSALHDSKSIYFQALNPQNAQRKLDKYMLEVAAKIVLKDEIENG